MTTVFHNLKLVVLALAMALHAGDDQPHVPENDDTVELHHRRD